MTIIIPFKEFHGLPSIDNDGQLCEDNLNNEEIIYSCPKCYHHLFNNKQLNWMKGGYWTSPKYTLKLKNYSPEDEILTCKNCGNKIKISFFSYMG